MIHTYPIICMSYLYDTEPAYVKALQNKTRQERKTKEDTNAPFEYAMNDAATLVMPPTPKQNAVYDAESNAQDH